MDIVEDVGNNQCKELLNGSLYGKLNPNIAKLLLNKHGYNDRQEIDNTHSYPDQIEVKFVKSGKKPE